MNLVVTNTHVVVHGHTRQSRNDNDMTMTLLARLRAKEAVIHQIIPESQVELCSFQFFQKKRLLEPSRACVEVGARLGIIVVLVVFALRKLTSLRQS